jgi:hypothetical protein
MSPNQASRATRIDPELIGDVRDEVAWSLAVQGLRHRSTLTERFAISIEWAISRIIIERRREGSLIIIPRLPYLPLLQSVSPQMTMTTPSWEACRLLAATNPEGDHKASLESVSSGESIETMVWRTGYIMNEEQLTKPLATPSMSLEQIVEICPVGKGIGADGYYDDVTLIAARVLSGGWICIALKATGTDPPSPAGNLIRSATIGPDMTGPESMYAQALDQQGTQTVIERMGKGRAWERNKYTILLLDPLWVPAAAASAVPNNRGQIPNMRFTTIDDGCVHPSCWHLLGPSVKAAISGRSGDHPRNEASASAWCPSFYPDYRETVGPSQRIALSSAILYGPDDITRAIACSGHSDSVALQYAIEVDKGPNKTTIDGTQYSYHILEYANKVPGAKDTQPYRKMLLEKLIKSAHRPKGAAEEILRWAEKVDEGPKDDTRTMMASIGLQDVRSAGCLIYAFTVDNGMMPETDKACLEDPYTAYLRDRYILGNPTDEGRASASKNTTCALVYAMHVDEAPSSITLSGVLDGDQEVPASHRLLRRTHRENLCLPEGWEMLPTGDYYSSTYDRRGEDLVGYAFDVVGARNELIEQMLGTAQWPSPLCRYLLRWPKSIDHGVLMALATPNGFITATKESASAESDLYGYHLAKMILGTRTRRRNIIEQDTTGEAILEIATSFDEGKRKDTFQRFMDLAKRGMMVGYSQYSNYLKHYYDRFVSPALPPKNLRYGFAQSRVFLDTGWSRKHYYRGSWGSPARDYDEIFEKKRSQMATALEMAASDLHRRRLHRASSLISELAKRAWASDHYGLSNAIDVAMENQEASSYLERTGIDRALWWRTLPGEMFTYTDEPHRRRPLVSTMSETKLPPSVFVPVLGDPPAGRWNGVNVGIESPFTGGAPPRDDHRKSTLLRICGLDEDTVVPIEDRLLRWLSSLDNRDHSYVRRRLELGGPRSDWSEQQVLSHMTVIWGGATVLDATLWSPSPFVFQIDPDETPLMHAFRYSPRDDIAGWMMVLPARTCQISTWARSEILYK